MQLPVEFVEKNFNYYTNSLANIDSNIFNYLGGKVKTAKSAHAL